MVDYIMYKGKQTEYIDKGSIVNVSAVVHYPNKEPLVLCYSPLFKADYLTIPINVFLFCAKEYKE